MMSDDEGLSFYHKDSNFDLLLNDLLQEPEEPIHGDDHQVNHQIQMGNCKINAVENDQEFNINFKLSFLENEELYYELPEKPFQQINEEDLIIESTDTKKNNSQINTSSKKNSNYENKLPYSQEVRELKIQRYRQKKIRRCWVRKVFYDCRKVVADSRIRINGRFTKKSPLLQLSKGNIFTPQLVINIECHPETRIQDFYL